MKFVKPLHDTRSRRRLLLGAYSLLLLAVLASVLLIASLLLISKISLSDKLAEIGDVVAAGTAILALIAGLVALQAYAAATGLPNLEVQVWFYSSPKNLPVFRARELHSGVLETTSPETQTIAMISLRNRSSYSARDPVVILKLASVMCDASRGCPSGEDWTVFELPESPATGKELLIQWDGGASCSIHGHSSRRLPDLNFGTLSYNLAWKSPVMRIEIVADGGYRRDAEVRLHFLTDDGIGTGAPALSNMAEWL